MSKVEKTERYDQFRLMSQNREVRDKHVQALKKSIKNKPTLLAARPILVNERMEVIDGQHRLEAARELGVPIYYTVVKGLTINDAQSLNLNQKNWRAIDFAHSFAATGNKHYEAYLKVREEFPGHGHRVIVSALRNGMKTSGHGSDGGRRSVGREGFNYGSFEIEDLELAYTWLERVEDFADLVEFSYNGAWVQALFKLFQHPEYDHARMVDKVKKHGQFMLGNKARVADFVRDLEEVYNYHQPEDSRVRFF